ncbi:MAG TPA: glycerol kinase GlpK [Bacilli bacterium]|nr:glycerol kinase GlpK [Bacilli bacterium]
MMKKYVLTIDQGTTSTRAILFDENACVKAIAQEEVKCYYPKPSYVEQDAIEIWLSVLSVINKLLISQNLTFTNIETVGITNQRETTVVWDKNTGMPVYKAIVWQSGQSASYLENLGDAEEMIHHKTGLLINPYFSASKIRYILDRVPNGQERAEKGELLFGTIDSWLIYKLTNEEKHVTDVTNASRTLLFNIHTLEWDTELLELFNIPRAMLPRVFPSSAYFGKTKYFQHHLKITGVAGDQQAALFGQLCLDEGSAKNTYGTGCFMLMNTGKTPKLSKNGLLTTIAWQIGDEVTYALEGSVFIGGAAVQWLRDELKLFKEASYTEKAAKESKDDDIYFVPAFVGLGTPYWDSDARGALFGLTRETTPKELIRATLEAIAYQSRDVFDVMKAETKIDLAALSVDGGASVNSYLMQFQADILNTEIRVPKIYETTSLGVCYLAGLYTGYFKSVNELNKIHEYAKTYKPKMTKQVRDRKYRGWKKAIAATISFTEKG